jgi:hypothetical protein
MEMNPHEERVLCATQHELGDVVRQQTSQGWTVVGLTTDPADGKVTLLLTRPIKGQNSEHC